MPQNILPVCRLRSLARAFLLPISLFFVTNLSALAAPPSSVTFTPIGFLSGDDYSDVMAVNDAVSLAACLSYHRDPGNGMRVYSFAARWTPGDGIQPLPLLSDTANADPNVFNFSVAARDLTNDGSRIIYNSHTETSSTLAVGIADPDGSNLLNVTALPNGDKMTKATQLSDDGLTAFGHRFGGVSGFAALGSIWTAAGGVQALVPPIGFGEILPASGAIAANGSASAGTFGNTDANGVYLAEQAYRWTSAGGVKGIGYLPGDNRSTAFALTSDGSTILGSCWTASDFGTPRSTFFLWTKSGGMTELSSPQIDSNSTLSGSAGMSGDGQILMISGFIRRLNYPFYFAIDDLLVQAGAGSAIDGWSHFSVNGLTKDGNTVWGQATNPSGRPEGFIAQFAPGYFDTLVAPLPQITSSLSAAATLNESYNYLIQASGMPESFGATNLPAGFTIQTGFFNGLKVGILSGTPASTGVFSIPISATNVSGSAMATLTLTVQYQGYVPRLLNISTRTQVLTDDKVLIAGFIIPEGGPKKVLVRAIGPSLADFGVNGALLDPTLELHFLDGTTVVNDNWKDSQQSEIETTQIPPSDDRESALVATLDPGLYTAIVSGKNGNTGVGLVEVYDLDDVVTSRMANISTRGFIETDDNVLIGGIIVAGVNPAHIVVRALGPSLTAAGVAGALADPRLEIHGADGSILFSNDDWRELQETDIEASGLAPTDDRESAIVATLPASNYTAIVSGKDGTTGVGLVEVYNVD